MSCTIFGDSIKFGGTLSVLKLVKTDFEIKTLSIKIIIISGASKMAHHTMPLATKTYLQDCHGGRKEMSHKLSSEFHKHALACALYTN